MRHLLAWFRNLARDRPDPVDPPEPLRAVRRRDQERGDSWIRAFLGAAPVGVLATSRDGRVFLNPNLYFYDPDAHALYLHTARVGRTASNVASAGDAGTPVTFVTYTMGRLLPADTALEFSVEYASVVVFGRAHVVEDPGEARTALQRLLDRYAPHLHPGRDYRPIQPQELRRTAVYRIDVEAWSGKQEAAALDHPGACPMPTAAVPFPAEA